MSVEPLSIKDWNLGVGESPYIGFAQMVNTDIFTKPGCVKISNKLFRDTGSVGIITELIIWTAQDPRTGDIYAVDRGGTLYKRTAGGAVWSVIGGHGTAGALGQGIAIWKDYLFYARSNKIDVYGPLTAGSTWTNNWAPALLSNSDTHPMIIGADGRLYIGNLNFIDTLEEVFAQTFDPANPATYNYSNEALPLPSNYKVTTLELLGQNISIGTSFGINGIFNIADNFFWDGFSEFISANQTVRFADDGVQMQKNVGNVLWTISGTGAPRIFKSAISQGIEVRRFNNVGDGNVRLFAAAINQKDGEILFGIGQSLGAGGVSPMGVYSVRSDMSTGSLSYTARYLISTGNDGSTGVLMIGTVSLISPTEILVTWYDSRDPDTFGADILSNKFYTNYEAYIDSAIYTVGTDDDPTTYEEVEVRLGKRLKTGDGITVQGRKSLDDTWTTLATFDTPTYVGRDFFKTKVANLSKFKDAQFRIRLTAAPTSVESLELKEVVFQ